VKYIIASVLVVFAANAWSTPNCSKSKGTIVDQKRKMGQSDPKIPIEHIVVLMQENHAFDAYLGRLNQPKFYGNEVDGIQETMWNPDSDDKKVFAHHETNLCSPDPEHDWNAIHREWNGGLMDGFVLVNDVKGMGYYDETDVPFYYDIANKFSIADRYFCSALTQTFPNRFFLYAGTAFGHIQNDLPQSTNDFPQRTIFDVMNENGVTWKYYHDEIGYLHLFQPLFNTNQDKIVPESQYKKI